MRGLFTGGVNGGVVTFFTERLRAFVPDSQGVVSGPQFGESLIEALPNLCALHAFELLKEIAAFLVVYGPAVIRVDQAQIPEFAALINVGDPGRGQFQQRLRKRSYPAGFN